MGELFSFVDIYEVFISSLLGWKQTPNCPLGVNKAQLDKEKQSSNKIFTGNGPMEYLYCKENNNWI